MNRSSRQSTRLTPIWTTKASPTWSTTARHSPSRRTQMGGPFDYILKQQSFPTVDANAVEDDTPFDKFMTSNIHEVLKVCAELRPSVDISVVPTRRG